MAKMSDINIYMVKNSQTGLFLTTTNTWSEYPKVWSRKSDLHRSLNRWYRINIDRTSKGETFSFLESAIPEDWEIVEITLTFAAPEPEVLEKRNKYVRKGQTYDLIEEAYHMNYNEYWNEWKNEDWETSELSRLEELLKDGGVFLDIGAWIGPYTVIAEKTATVYAIEPDPTAYQILVKNVVNNGSTTCCLQAAASTNNQDVILKTSVEDIWGSSLSSMHSSATGDGIAVAGIDTVALLAAINPTLVKCDIEGGEVILLPYIGPYLRKHKIPLFLSLHPQIYDPAPQEFIDELSKWNLETLNLATDSFFATCKDDR